jgi:uncharacterized surface anchored protein
MPKETIHLNQKLYDEQGKVMKESTDTAEKVKKRLQSLDITKFSSTEHLINELYKFSPSKELTIKSVLERIALLDMQDNKEVISDFDLYLEIRSSEKTIELEENQLKRLKDLCMRTALPKTLKGQIYYILSGKSNTLK